MLICDCGNWMHTEGVDESAEPTGVAEWVVRCECRRCDRHVGAIGRPEEVFSLVDRLFWSDEAKHRVDRMPPYVQVLIRPEVEDFARHRGERVITDRLLSQARNGGTVEWTPEAEQRLERVPAAVRAMARQELERTALERGHSQVTVAVMEEVKARYFGMFQKSAES